MKVLIVDHLHDDFVVLEEAVVPKKAIAYFNRKDYQKDWLEDADKITEQSFIDEVGSRFQIFELGDELTFESVLVSKHISNANKEE